MRGLTIVGIVLIVLGLVALFAGGLSYTKDQDTAEIGPIDVTVTERERVNIPPAFAIAALVGGLMLVVVGMRRRGI